MLPKEDREIIYKIGRYKYNKMKKMDLTYLQFIEYEKEKQKEKKLKEKIGYRAFNQMKKMGLSYEEYKQYQKEQKLKKYKVKREKDKIRQKTIRYIERYCELEMKCQICKTEKDVQIHHPNYKEYLKINLLCRKHHNNLHNFELVPPEIIDLENIAKIKPPRKERQKQIHEQIKDIKEDILKNGYSYKKITDKYKVSNGTIKKYLQKESDWKNINNVLRKNGEMCIGKLKHKNNPIQKYRIDNNLSIKEFSKLTQIPIPTIRALECGKTDLEKIKSVTKQKLSLVLTNKI